MALKVNFSEQEASSEALSFDPIPTGKYYARVTDITERECGPESKNPGKPYWAVEFTIQDGEFENRKLWANVMLFEGALYSLVQLLKATGHTDALASGNVPDAEDFISAEVNLNVRKLRDAYAEARDGDGVAQWKNEVKGILPYASAAGVPVKKGGKGSLLP